MSQLDATSNGNRSAASAGPVFQGSEEIYRNLFDSLQDGIFVIQDGVFVLVNSTTEMLTGYQADELIGQPFTKVIAPEDEEQVVENYRRRQAGEQLPEEYIIHVLQKDGQTRVPVNLRPTVINHLGRVATMGSLRNLSEKMRMEQELRDSQRKLQESYDRRGFQVKVSNEIGQEIAAANSVDEIFTRVVTLVQERLGYYHTQLLRYEPALNAVILVKGYGEIGEKMLAAGHRLEMGRGLIGSAAAIGQTVMRPEVINDPGWRPNPLLPETQGEIAVPIKYGDRVLGVLDVQSSQDGALTEDDRLLLEGLCGLVAIALEGTRLRQEMQERLNELNRLYAETARAGWASFRETGKLTPGYVFDRTEVHPVETGSAADAAVVPLAVRGEVIGALGIYDDPQRKLTVEELSLIEQVSDQVALALENARLFEQTTIALDEAERTSQQLVEALNAARMANWEFDVASGMFVFNEEYYRFLGTTVEKEGSYLMPAPVFAEKFVHPEDATDVGIRIQAAMQTRDPEFRAEFEARLRRPDGSYRAAVVSLRVEKDAQGNTIRMYGTNQDITERKEAQETIAKRAVELATVAEITTRVSTIQSPDEMLQTAVDLTRQAFGLYHVHIDMLNESGDTLVIASGAGETGRKMVAEGRRIPLDAQKSLAARAARSRQGVIVNNVEKDADFLPHPLLPDTRSEMAVPMIAGDRLLGVIDVQDNQVNRFTPEDVNIMTTLAAQIAVSLQNAYSYARAQRQAEREALINAISERIQATSSVESALQVAVREIGRALGAQHTAVRLGLERKADGS